MNMRWRRHLVYATLCLIAGCATPGTTEEKEFIPDNLAAINLQLGIEYSKEGNYEAALAKLRKALEIEPNYPSAHHVIAVVYDQIGERAKAEEHFKRSIELDPRDSQTLNDYGAFLCRLGRAAEAYPLFERAIANPLYKTPELAHANAGVCAARAQDLVRAEKELRAALSINSNLPSALLEMAAVSYDQAQYLPARAYLQRYLEVARHNARSLWLGVRIERKLGDVDAIASYSLALRERFPDSEEARLLRESEGR